jgi:hypothetical protein
MYDDTRVNIGPAYNVSASMLRLYQMVLVMAANLAVRATFRVPLFVSFQQGIVIKGSHR